MLFSRTILQILNTMGNEKIRYLINFSQGEKLKNSWLEVVFMGDELAVPDNIIS